MDSTCPICEKAGTVRKIITSENFNIRGDNIKVKYEAYECTECGEKFVNPKTSDDPLLKAYRLYRNKHGMLQPEEIKEIRTKYGLTQNEMSKLLGFGGATLSRYENGGLQDKTHDNQLRLVSDPRNMLKLVMKNRDFLSETRASELIANIEKMAKDEYSLKRVLMEWVEIAEPSIFTGFQNFSIDKLTNAILFLCMDGEFKTKINKLLFYADFKHFKEYSVGITGLRYIHLPYGPVPERYSIYLEMLVYEEALIVEEVFYPEFVGERYVTVAGVSLDVFSDTELEVLSMIKRKFRNLTASQLSDLSHEERGYKETSDKEPIPYDYAEFLNA